ncbi:sugar phosphate isomerase/epimerase [Metabacillus sp. GX 13764]|uniref:sugar phosphate isomerase/epimerase family protein n=1 Tax=Metabacillus kandeliae TaxID=2900151 RepID=UPI001E3725E6|nr:sugar phosphate isomerase/epimerase [Metabacillus kandeliae]MCD7035524.1 sugar phosphate isomerase/epimerase [Metabacillus kandeliae]
MRDIPLSLCSTGFKELSAEEVIAAASQCRLDGIEWWMGHLKNQNLSKVEENHKKNGLAIPILSEYTSFSKGEEACQQDVKKVQEAFLAAEQLQVPFIRIFAGHQPSRDTGKEERRAVAEALRELCSEGKKYGVKLVLETHNHTLADDADSIAQLVKEVNSPSLCLLYDPFNFLVDKKDPREVLKLQDACIVHVHLKNLLWNHDCWDLSKETDVYSGDLDMLTVLAMLQELNYSGFYSLEYFGKNKVRLIHESALLLKK